MDDWQPIDTGPKDGTRVSLWCASEPQYIAGQFKYGDWIDDYGRIRDATHWQPAPMGPREE